MSKKSEKEYKTYKENKEQFEKLRDKAEKILASRRKRGLEEYFDELETR